MCNGISRTALISGTNHGGNSMHFILPTPPPNVLGQILENVVEFYNVYCDNIYSITHRPLKIENYNVEYIQQCEDTFP